MLEYVTQTPLGSQEGDSHYSGFQDCQLLRVQSRVLYWRMSLPRPCLIPRTACIHWMPYQSTGTQESDQIWDTRPPQLQRTFRINCGFCGNWITALLFPWLHPAFHFSMPDPKRTPPKNSYVEISESASSGNCSTIAMKTDSKMTSRTTELEESGEE